MKISYNWLRNYVDIPETPEEIGQVLTSTGLEVEHIEHFETVKGGLKGLVIGEVVSCSKHPNADKLSLTTVNVGDGTLRKIVCGAPNVATGQKVVVALPGTTVYPLKGDAFEIKLAKIRGEQSEGMICAEDEVGLGESHAGIMVLDAGARPGSSAAEYFKVQSDAVIEIGLTPNRADAASHLGVARDIRAAKDRAIKWPSVDAFQAKNKSLPIPVEIKNPEACPRFSGVTISGVSIKESPAWLQDRLKSIGLTPINNVVDITNFVCHELGQPLHAYDALEVGKKVLVQTLPAGTKFTTLDGKERSLTSNDLMICNEKGEGMCIAGVFGGSRSGVSDATTTLFLESAYFSPSWIRKTSMHHQLKTDASFRFERGTDPEGTVFALKRAAMMICEIAGGFISSEVVDEYGEKIAPAVFAVKYHNLDRLIGISIPKEEIFSILERLDIRVLEKTKEGFRVSVPPYRVDVKQEADIVEEVLRIYGLNNIPLSTSAGTAFISGFPEKDEKNFRRSVGELLAANGFYEILTNSLTNEAYYSRRQVENGLSPVAILNKLSEEQGVLRTTMLFTGLEVCAFNINRKQKNLKLFEFGKVYGKQGSSYVERERLAIYVTGQADSDSWRVAPRPVAYADLFQAVAGVLEKSAISNYEHVSVADSLFDYAMSIRSGKEEIGRLGKVSNAFQKDFGLKQEIFFADIDAALLFKAATPKFDVKDVPRFPEVRRDLSLVLDNKITYGEIEKVVRSTERKLIKEIVVFDVYVGDKIPEGKKAYAVGFTIQDEMKTLTDEEIDRTMEKLIGAFEKQLNAVIRK
jgi:phenylalanyl-tRNA synthetase beta chain